MNKELTKEVYEQILTSKELFELGPILKDQFAYVVDFAKTLYDGAFKKFVQSQLNEWKKSSEKLKEEFKDDPRTLELVYQKHIEVLENYILKLQQKALLFEGCVYALAAAMENNRYLISLYNPKNSTSTKEKI